MSKEKKKLFVSAGILVGLFVAVLVLQSVVNNAQKRLALMESVYEEMSGNRAELISMSEETKILQARAGQSRDRNFASEMETAASDFGLSKNLKKINFVTHREEGHFSADDYELVLEGVDINTAVNFLYRISNDGVIIKVKKCLLTVGFENPNILNISLLVSHLK